jgi:hypothetical protein
MRSSKNTMGRSVPPEKLSCRPKRIITTSERRLTPPTGSDVVEHEVEIEFLSVCR